MGVAEIYGKMEQFKAAKYRICIEVGEKGMYLPPYKGSTFRGGFGSTFRRVVCSMKTGECKGCLLQANCPYAYIFETAPSLGAEVLKNYENVPRPFVIEPPIESKTYYASGEIITFRLLLFGKAISFLPYFIVVFRELGASGIGKGRNPYLLKNITAVGLLEDGEETVYRAEDQTVVNANRVVSGSDIISYCGGLNVDAVDINFITMTRLKYNKSFVNHPEFHVLIRNLLRRISSLMYFHHDLELELDFKGVIQRAEQVKIISDKTRWVDWERYSNRQAARMSLGGIVGKASYEGALAEFMPFMKLGEIAHIGKAATFGMGKYKILIDYCSH
jgi:hypothetical protein